jgi:hypothetical protein
MTQEINMRLKTRKWQQKINFDKHVANAPLRNLNPTKNVIFRNNDKWCPATIVANHASPRSYILRDKSERKLRRNRKHIRPTNAQFADTESADPVLQEGLQTRTAQQADGIPKTDSATNDGQENNPVITKSGRIVKQPIRFKDSA